MGAQVFTFGDIQCNRHSSLKESHISGCSPLATFNVKYTVAFKEKVTSMGVHLW